MVDVLLDVLVVVDEEVDTDVLVVLEEVEVVLVEVEVVIAVHLHCVPS